MTKSIHDDDFQLEKVDHSYKYQEKLTPKLDALAKPFDQEVINQIVLWKVNRYAEPDPRVFDLINQIDPNARELDIDLTKQILDFLLNTHGIKLPMASTILKFKNKYIYQIIDQRVYRIIYQGKSLKIPAKSNPKTITDQIDLYINYLDDLQKTCDQLNIPFEISDRVLYMADKRVNAKIPLKK